GVVTVAGAGVRGSGQPVGELYWAPAQQVARLTVNGASVRTGDLCASGTISGPRLDQVGSFLELTEGGREPVALSGSGSRAFLADGDSVTIRGRAAGVNGGVVDLGAVEGRVVPLRG